MLLDTSFHRLSLLSIKIVCFFHAIFFVSLVYHSKRPMFSFNLTQFSFLNDLLLLFIFLSVVSSHCGRVRSRLAHSLHISYTLFSELLNDALTFKYNNVLLECLKQVNFCVALSSNDRASADAVVVSIIFVVYFLGRIFTIFVKYSAKSMTKMCMGRVKERIEWMNEERGSGNYLVC